MMQCSSAGAQIQYSRHRIFFGFEDEIAGVKALLRVVREWLSICEEVTAGYYSDLHAKNQHISKQKKLSVMLVATAAFRKQAALAAAHRIGAPPK